MDNIRRGKTKYRGLLIVVVVVLCISLVSSFAMLGSPSGQGDADSSDPQQLKVQAEALQSSITTAEAVEKKDYTANNSLAELYTTLSGVYAQMQDNTQSAAAAKKAAVYYQACLDTAPKELNATGKANLYERKAVTLFTSGDAQGADIAYKKALELDPLNLQVTGSYVNYLIFNGQIDAAIAYLKVYQSKVPAGGEEFKQAQQWLASLEQLKESDATKKQDEQKADGEKKK